MRQKQDRIDRVTSRDLREQFGNLINEYSDIRAVQEALENQDGEFDDWLEDDDNRKYAEADSSFKESMAESYFRRYGRDAEFEEI